MFVSRVLKGGNMNGFRFSTVSEIANKTYAKFQKAYSQNTKSFEDSMKEFERSAAEEAPKRNKQKAYQHPYETDTNSIVFGGIKNIQLWKDFVGAEQISPHYENFLMSRKNALGIWGTIFLLVGAMNVHDLHWIAKSLTYPFIFYTFMFYWWVEGKKSLIKPFLSNFYRKITWLEINNIQSYFIENEEAKVRKLMKVARAQLDFQKLHNEYTSMRNNSILNFLINEQINLKNHLNSRAVTVLRAAEGFEDVNSKKIIEKLVDEAKLSLDKVFENNRAKIEGDMFKLALKGLEEGKMDYSKDPFLGLINENINTTIQRFEKMSPADQQKLTSLTEEQIEQLKNIDKRYKDEFLSNAPKVDGPLKANAVVSKALESWTKHQ